MKCLQNMSIPSTDSLFWTKNRLKTFDNWPFKDSSVSCNPKQMAAAGFIAIGGEKEPDLVECIFCFKQLDGWESSDDPWSEHARHQTTCPFISLNKRDEMTWTVEETFNLLKHFKNQNLERRKEKLVETVKKMFHQNKENALTTIKNTLNKK